MELTTKQQQTMNKTNIEFEIKEQSILLKNNKGDTFTSTSEKLNEDLRDFLLRSIDHSPCASSIAEEILLDNGIYPDFRSSYTYDNIVKSMSEYASLVRGERTEVERVEKIFYIDEVRTLINQFNIKEISLSKLVETLNESVTLKIKK